MGESVGPVFVNWRIYSSPGKLIMLIQRPSTSANQRHPPMVSEVFHVAH
jgi:hypothetical protein